MAGGHGLLFLRQTIVVALVQQTRNDENGCSAGAEHPFLRKLLVRQVPNVCF